MSGNPAFFTLHQGAQAPAQASHGQGNPVPINQANGYQANGYAAVPRSMANPQHSQYQQPQRFQHMYTQHQQPRQSGEFRHTPERRRGGGVSSTSDIRQACMTESDMRESLSEYKVYYLVKGSVANDLDARGNPALPTWENVERDELPLEKYEATELVDRLEKQGTVPDKLGKLKPGLRRQVNELLADLEEDEEKDGDPRYCYVIAQLHSEIGKIPYEQYLRDKRNQDDFTEKDWKRLRQLLEGDKDKKKAGSRYKVKSPKDKDWKSEDKKETKSMTVYYKRIPKPDVDVVAMYEMAKRAGRATQTGEHVERPYQQHRNDMPIHHQEMNYGHPQHPQYQQTQNFQQPQYPPQNPQQHHQYQQHQQHQQNQQNQQQQYYNTAQQAQQLQSRPTPEGAIPIPPIPPKAPLPAAPRDHGKPIVISQGSAQKIKGEPVKIVNVSPGTKNKPREKRYPIHSARSSRSSIYSEEDIFSVDSETSRSSMPSDVFVDKRGRTKGKGKGRRERSESADWSRSRSRGRDWSRRRSTHRPELYGLRQHTVGGYGGFGSPPLGGILNARPPPPAPPSTEKDGISSDALKTIYNLGKMEGQKQASGKGINEPVSPRIIYEKRPVMQDSEDDFDDVLVGDKVYERHAYGRHDGSGMRPAEKVYPQPPAMPRASRNQFRAAPAPAYGREYPSAPSDDYSNEHEFQYTHTPAPQPRAQPRPQSRPQTRSPEGRSYEQPAFRHTQYEEGPYMSGGLRERVEVPRENPFKPMPRRQG